MKLNIGGNQIHKDWTIFNIQKKRGVDIVGDLKDLSQFKPDSIEEIYASHVLEHTTQKNCLEVLKYINRILIPGGKFYISVPNMDVLCALFINPKATYNVKFSLMRMMFGGQIDDYDYHYFGWNYDFMVQYLTQANFTNFKKVNSLGLFNDMSEIRAYGHLISLNIIARKQL